MKIIHKFSIFVFAALLLVVSAIAISIWSFNKIQAALDVRDQNTLIIDKANALLSALKDAETGQRGYLLTGDETFLRPYLTVRDSMAANITELHALTKISAASQHLHNLELLISAKMDELKNLIALRHANKLATVASVLGEGRGQRLMNSIRAEMMLFIEIETNALVQKEASFQSKMRHMFNIIIGAGVFWILFTLALIYLIYRQSQQKLKNLIHLETQHLLEVQEHTNKQLRQVNMTLQESEEKLAVTLNSIGDAVITTDAQARITLLNPLAEQLTGWKLTEVLGQPIADVFLIINKATRLVAKIPVMETLAKATIQGLANHTVLIARDGSECDIADSCAPILNRHGQVVGAVLVFRNVSKEYAVQQALRDNAALIQAILNTVADGIITLHANNGTIETVNPTAQKMFGFSAEELIGLNLSVLIPELDQAQRNSSLQYYSASDEARAVGIGREVTGWRKDNKPFPLEIAVSEMWLGGERYFTCIIRDISVRKQIEAERTALNGALQLKNIELEHATFAAEKANLAKSDFLSSMSHELRTPLGAILGFAQLIESGTPALTTSQKKSIDQILKAGWYLLELINEVLDLALIESGKLELSLEPVLLIDVMNECEAMIEPQARKRDITVIFTPPELPYCIKGDHTRVKQVLINLLSNAIKYNKINGTVTVECSKTFSDFVRISVHDTGAGLTSNQLSQLFQPFNRLGQNSKEEGTGIGLVVCKRLMNLMKGKIGVESSLGKGSVFWIELALSNISDMATQSEADFKAGSESESNALTYTLLYVEDNPANLKLVEDIIAQRSDIRLFSAKSARQGIKLARATLPDVILMDINLPGFSGFEVFDMLSEDPKTAHIPVVALSANAMPRDIEKGLEAGFFRYLTKPIKIKEFMETIDLTLKFAKTGKRLE